VFRVLLNGGKISGVNHNRISDNIDFDLARESEAFLIETVRHALEDYEIRPSQIGMMNACSRRLESKGTLLAEAGTGTGKTFAYLIPAILSGKKALVSTRTINLQEQLVSKDLRFLSSLKDFDFAIAKGRGHYLCKRRLNAFNPTDRNEVEDHKNVLEWLMESETGDIEDYASRKMPAIWDKICSDADACKGKKCSYYGDCYYFTARQRWSQAQIIVTNHALLAVNSMMQHDSRILPKSDIMVIDEAHALDSVFSEQIGIRISKRGVENLLNRLLKTYERDRYKGLLSKSPALFPLVESLRMQTVLFWEQVANELKSRRIIRGSFPLKYVFTALIESINTLIENIKTSATGLFGEDEEIELKAAMIKLLNLSADMETFCEETDGFVRWVELEENRKILRMSPTYPSEFIANTLLPEYSSVIFTSATLSVSGDFSLIEKTIGVSDSDRLSVPSPFNIKEQVKLEIRNGIDLKNENGVARLSRVIVTEASGAAGGTLVLFTSKDIMKKTWELISEELRSLDLNPLIQGEISNRKMLETMRSSRNTVLFGLDSFWEGVDVRGDALKCLIITKLPFEVPTEPIVQARTELIEKEGGNAFYEYSLPRAVLKFKQGFGRLIRTKTDVGRVIVCDERILTKAYGKKFLENTALPSY
jgi:ATP-dependent DNA helicase DinG